MDNSEDIVFGVGDLVLCTYDLYEGYAYFFDLPREDYPFRGVIVEVQEYIEFADRFGYDELYIVRCFDGNERFFTYSELKLLSHAKKVP
ncbi:MAG: hypothetical protein HOJ16_05165 [Candidatus Peribacter sp.]|nr:hypothetical protein [Candidatus Peribacter sp.]MBT7339203.1 hypothetical protein [Candidatus Jacksonbacteria bacterium]